MNPEEHRRTFITGLACGAPLLAAGSVAAFARSFRASDHPHSGATEGDALVEYLTQQLASSVQAISARGSMRADEARTAASHLQILAVHAQTTRFDDRARRALQRRIASVGRDAIVTEPTDMNHVRIVLARRGIEIPQRLTASGSAPRLRDRAASVDLVLAGHTSSAFTHIAATLESTAARLGDADHGTRDVQLEGMCQYLFGEWMLYAGLAAVFCPGAESDPGLANWCEAMWTSALLSDFAYWSYC